uniref:Uncharacterized protein n=1 Tax=Anguilla anguilla TaxID=7936 RepID=A0A0E9QRM2_ANGAN
MIVVLVLIFYHFYVVVQFQMMLYFGRAIQLHLRSLVAI